MPLNLLPGNTLRHENGEIPFPTTAEITRPAWCQDHTSELETLGTQKDVRKGNYGH
jgi:hypothetical protein